MTKKLILIFVLVLFASSCTENKKNKNTDEYKQFNITILLDLSDRIIQKNQPSQIEKDIKSIMTVVQFFKEQIVMKGTQNSDDKIRVLFYPQISDSKIPEIAQNLNIDLGKLNTRSKKQIFAEIDTMFSKNLLHLYQIATTQSVFKGSDLYNFFKYRVEDDCIIKDKNTKNILLVYTDGYLFSENQQITDSNRFTYIAPKSKHISIFRNNPNWENVFVEENYGFLSIDKDLSNLQIIMLEFAPFEEYPRDFEILSRYWDKWFGEMNVKKAKYIKSDLPSTNNAILNRYLQEF